jgi:hypothetical protein
MAANSKTAFFPQLKELSVVFLLDLGPGQPGLSF